MTDDKGKGSGPEGEDRKLEEEKTLAVSDRTTASQRPDGSPRGRLPGEATERIPGFRPRSIVLELHEQRGEVDRKRRRKRRRLKDLHEERPLPDLTMGPERYDVVESVGEGGMGRVYLVLDRDLKRPVALKMVRSDSRELEERFLEEAQVMGQLQHPNIVPVYELGLTEHKRTYYTMPLLRGKTLRDILEQLRVGAEGVAQTYSLARLVQIFMQIAQAMSYAHARGVIHRDLKPANVMLGEHGEVQVLDWGLSRVMADASDDGAGSEPSFEDSTVVGTPWYMSPEQACGEPVDQRSDIYALGVILYEILTLRRPFEGKALGVLAAVARDEPEPPRARAPERYIPVELERACMKAIAKSPKLRHQNVSELFEQVEEWLEGEADRSKRRGLADERVAEAGAELDRCDQRKAEVERLVSDAEDRAQSYLPWQSVVEKAPLFEVRKRARAAAEQLEHSRARAVQILTEALGFDPDHEGARALLADYYWVRLLEAEARHDAAQLQFFRDLVVAYHDGKYERELAGDGTLAVDSQPFAAEVWLHEWTEDGLCLGPGEGRLLGKTPLEPVTLGMGSYLVVLKKEGYRDCCYPVLIERCGEWSGTVRLFTDATIGEDYCHIPAGPFWQGGDPEAHRWVLPRTRKHLDDYFIGRHPVTMEEYLEFINELAATDEVAARRRAPRAGPDAPDYLVRRADGLLGLPDSTMWPPRLPVFGISYEDADVYCRWRTERDGEPVRLPTEDEWEKAARGVDGRWYPWGWEFDPSLANLRESRREDTLVVPIDEFPCDVSPYGLRGCGGNVQDWTQTEVRGDRGEELRVVRGGAWALNRLDARCAYRDCFSTTFVNDIFGLRLVREPKRRRS